MLYLTHPIRNASRFLDDKVSSTKCVDWSKSLMSFFSRKTDILSEIAIYKPYLGVVLGFDIRLNLTIRENRILI